MSEENNTDEYMLEKRFSLFMPKMCPYNSIPRKVFLKILYIDFMPSCDCTKQRAILVRCHEHGRGQNDYHSHSGCKDKSFNKRYILASKVG